LGNKSRFEAPEVLSSNNWKSMPRKADDSYVDSSKVKGSRLDCSVVWSGSAKVEIADADGMLDSSSGESKSNSKPWGSAGVWL